MAFKRTFEVTCDHEDGNGKCVVEGHVMATSKEDANHKLVGMGWHYYDKGPSCVHYCPEHVVNLLKDKERA